MNHLIGDMLEIADEKRLQTMELLRLTKEQTMLLAEEDVEKLERYLTYKQNIICRVDSLDARYRELIQRVLSENNVCSLEDIREDSRIRRILEINIKTKNIMEEMLETDKKNSEMGKRLLEKLGNPLNHTGMTPLASRAYHSNLPPAFFIDRPS